MLGEPLPPLPEPNDLTVCFGCGEILEFTHNLHLRKTTASTIASLPSDLALKLRMTQLAIRQFLFP